MAWLSVSFEVAADDVEALSEALLEAGAASVDVADADAGSAAEQPAYGETGAVVPRSWRRSRLSALVPGNADVTALLADACRRAGVAPPPHVAQPVVEQDWVSASQQQFEPIRISPRLWIVPSWHAAPDAGAINIVLDPGLAFGTGSHPTTQLCLNWLERTIRGGESVIDYGCGSGILAIAAMKLGAGRADGVDIDGQALLAARRNAIQNQVPALFHDAAGAILQPAQIVVANILSRPLVVLAPLIARLTAPQGRLALAGMFGDQAEEVAAAYRPWFDIDVAANEGYWVLLSGARRP
jgi:ribosomal protein L11 methyltransferase